MSDPVILFIGPLGGGELVLIALVFLMFFGAKSIPSIARGLGKGIREFKDAAQGIQRDIQDSTKEVKEELHDAVSTVKDEATGITEVTHSGIAEATNSIKRETDLGR